MKFEKLKQAVENEFNEVITRFLSIEREMLKLKDEINTERQKAASEMEFHKRETKRIESLSLDADKKNEKASENIKESEARLRAAEDVLRSAKEKEELIRKRTDALTIQEKSSIETKQEADRKLKWAEMEERRLKFLEHKLNVILEDENIRKKLEELK